MLLIEWMIVGKYLEEGGHGIIWGTVFQFHGGAEENH